MPEKNGAARSCAKRAFTQPNSFLQERFELRGVQHQHWEYGRQALEVLEARVEILKQDGRILLFGSAASRLRVLMLSKLQQAVL